MSRTAYPPLLTRTAASKMTGLPPRYLDRLRLAGAVRTYETLGGGKNLFYRDELLTHLKLPIQENYGDHRQTGTGGNA